MQIPSFHCLLFICLVAFLKILTTVANKWEEHMKCVQLLNTLCNQFYICSVLLEYTLVYHCGKCNFPVTIILWSSTLPPLWVPCVPKITTAMQKNLFKDTSTQRTWMGEACQASRYDCHFAFHYLPTAYFKQLSKLLYLRFQERHFPWIFNIKDINCQQKVIPL